MATLQKLRNRAGLLVAFVIGLALVAFILGDLFSSGPSVFTRNRLQVAEIDGISINYMDYNKKIERLSEFYRASYQLSSLDQETLERIREEVWNNTVRDIVLGKSFEDLGISVSVDELKTMLLGDSLSTGTQNLIMEEPHPIVRRMFTNPETGQFNRYQMMNYFNAISTEAYKDERRRWLYFEDQIVDERLSQKYFTLVRKGLQPNNLEKRNYAIESNATIDFRYVYTNFNAIPDDDVTVSESEMKDYYNTHKYDFTQEEGRSIEYVVFHIEPSEEDDQEAQEFIAQSKVPFQRSENPINFVNKNSDFVYADKNYSRQDFPEEIADSIFNVEPGYVAGPYFEDNTYKIARLLEFNYVPDSVRARHILISLSVQRDETRAKEIADSLMQVVQSGGDFFKLAREFSADESNREIGGDLGWFQEGMMVEPFSNACFYGEEGDLTVVETRHGYHLIKIEEQSPKVKKAKVALVERQVNPSSETVTDIYSEAVDFLSNSKNIEGFREECIDQNITPRFASDIQKNVREIQGLENSREIIRWAYENEENSVSQIFDLGDKYVIAALTEAKEDDIADFEKVQAEIEIAVLKNKKIEALMNDVNEKINGINSMDEIADVLNNDINEVEKVKLLNPYVNGVGSEPKIVSKSYTLEEGQISNALKGENGVFVVEVLSKDIPEQPDLASAEFRLKYSIESRVSYEAYEALKEEANIVDNRLRFY